MTKKNGAASNVFFVLRQIARKDKTVLGIYFCISFCGWPSIFWNCFFCRK